MLFKIIWEWESTTSISWMNANDNIIRKSPWNLRWANKKINWVVKTQSEKSKTRQIKNGNQHSTIHPSKPPLHRNTSNDSNPRDPSLTRNVRTRCYALYPSWTYGGSNRHPHTHCYGPSRSLPNRRQVNDGNAHSRILSNLNDGLTTHASSAYLNASWLHSSSARNDI